MKKRKILFVIPSLDIGGAEKSLVGLLKYWNYSKFEVDVYSYTEEGELYKNIPKEANRLDSDSKYKYFFHKNLIKSVLYFIIHFHFYLAILRLLWGILPILSKFLNIEYHRNSSFDWICQRAVMKKNYNKYDIAIGYMEGESNYYVSECIIANRKIAWIHTDYSITQPNLTLDRKYLSKVDSIVTVSENSKCEIIKLLPELKNKIHVIPNIIDTYKIDRLKNIDIPYYFERSCAKLVSVGRLVKLKGFDICIEVANKLRNANYDFIWLFIGEGEEKDNLQNQIESMELKDYCFLIGATDNSYTYMNHADICVQLSQYEGRSLVIDEEQYLKKTIVASNIGAFRDVIKNGVNGYLVERSALNAFKVISEILDHTELRENIVTNLKNTVSSETTIVQKVENLFQ